jgi:hypothetical protein
MGAQVTVSPEKREAMKRALEDTRQRQVELEKDLGPHQEISLNDEPRPKAG